MSVPAGRHIHDPLHGSNNNAGYFKIGGSGTDYPRAQAAPILAITDLACSVGSTTVTTAAGGLTAAMVDNGCLVVSGTNLTPGLYHIVAVTDGNTMTFDRSPAPSSNGSAGVANIGGRRAVLVDAYMDMLTTYHYGQIYEVWATATMTLTGSIVLQSTSAGNPNGANIIEGRSSTGAAEPAGDDRPLISCGSYYLDLNANYWWLRDLRISGEGILVARFASYGVLARCYVANTSTTSNRTAFSTLNAYSTIVDSEVTCPYGTGIDIGYDGSHITRCYIHDCGNDGSSGARAGIDLTGMDSSGVEFCIIDTCREGWYGTISAGLCFAHNTVYNCSEHGHYMTSPTSLHVENCIFASCGYGSYHLTYEYPGSNIWDYNDYYDNTTDRNKTTVGDHDFAAAPSFTNAANGDFSRTTTTADGHGMTLGVS